MNKRSGLWEFLYNKWHKRGECLLLISVPGTIPVKLWSYAIIGLDRPLGLQKVEAPRISRQSAHGGNNVVSPMHRPPLPPVDILDTHFCHRLSRPKGHSALWGFKSRKIPMIPSEIEPATNQLPHCTPISNVQWKEMNILGVTRVSKATEPLASIFVQRLKYYLGVAGVLLGKPLENVQKGYIYISLWYEFH